MRASGPSSAAALAQFYGLPNICNLNGGGKASASMHRPFGTGAPITPAPWISLAYWGARGRNPSGAHWRLVKRIAVLAARCGALLAVVLAAAAACTPSASDTALDAYLEALRLSKTGAPIELQLAQVDRCIALMPTAADCLTMRGNLRMHLDRPREAREDFDRSIAAVDHPYTHFHRAEALCAIGEYQAALTDLDTAIVGQPWQDVFYFRRALARLAAGRIAEARADLERRGPLAGYGSAALHFVEGHPADAIAALDALAAKSSTGGAGSDDDLPHVLRMLSYIGLDQPERAAALYDHNRLKAAEGSPSSGYEYWLVPRGCDNAFLATQGGESIKRAREMFAAAAHLRAANSRLQTLRESCPSLAAQLEVTKGEAAAGSALAERLTDGMLSENEERCAYAWLSRLAVADAEAKELFRTRIAPVLANSPRALDHADRWLGSQAGGMLREVQNTFAANKLEKRQTTTAVPGLRTPPFWIERSSAGSFVVELQRTENGSSVRRPAPVRLQVIDEHGLRMAMRTAERQECAKTTADDDECIAVGDYEYSGQPLAPFAVAFNAQVKVVPLPLERKTLSRDAQEKYLAALFSAPPTLTKADSEKYSWVRVSGDDWVEQRTWREEYRPGWFRVAVTATGRRLSDCSLSVNGPLTEFACTKRRGTVQSLEHVVYLGPRPIGGHDNDSLGLSVRYAATIDGVPAYFFVVDWNSVSHVHVAFRVKDGWNEDVVASDRAAD
jgi:tetratricopeptide (TPR) repeat protein